MAIFHCMSLNQVLDKDKKVKLVIPLPALNSIHFNH